MKSREVLNRARICGLFLAVLLSPAQPHAAIAFHPEAGLPQIRSYPPEVYLSHHQVFATTQTPDGVLYFGTYGAVVSFDGERWRQYRVPGSWLRALCVGPDGLVYIGGGNVLGRLEPAADHGPLHFVSLVEKLPPERRDFGTVWSCAAAGDRVWFAIDGALLTWRDGAFAVSAFAGQRPTVRTVGARTFRHLGPELLAWRDGEWRPWLHDARLAATRRLTLMEGDAGGLVLGRDDGTLLRVAADGTVTEWETPARAFLRSAGLRNGVRLPDGGYALSSGGEGVVLLAPDGTPVRRLTRESGLAATATYGLFLAADGLLWIETANGLSQFDPRATWTVLDARSGRPDSIADAVLRFNGSLLLDQSDAVSLRLRPAASGLDPVRLEPFNSALPARLANNVELDGRLYSGGERGLMRLDEEPRLVHATSSQIEHNTPLRALPGVMVLGLLRGIEIVRLAPGDRAELIARVPEIDTEITNIAEVPGRMVWCGTTAGLTWRLRLAADGTVQEVTRFDATRGLPPQAGWVKLATWRDEILVCVRTGVFRYSAETDRLVPAAEFAQYRPAGINTLPIVSDGADRFWFQIDRASGGYQLGCLDLRSGKPVWSALPAGIDDALGYGGANSLSHLAEPSGETLWIGGPRAVVRLDLQGPTHLPPPPRAVISEVRNGPHRHTPAGGAPERFPFSLEPLRFLFSSPAAAHERVTYETRLRGYEASWRPATSPEVTYTNLIGGPFTLEVRARDSLGRVGESARTTFFVAPPWHHTTGAYALYALAAGGAVFGFVRWRLGQAERERRRLEQLVATRTNELAAARDQAEAASRAKSAFLASMSHELRTPLNGVIGYAQVLQGDTRLLPDQQERLRIVRSSGEHLLRMINDVLDLAKIEAGKLELRPAPLALADLLRDIAAAHAHAAAAKRLAFALDTAADLPAWVEGDAQKLRQILDNLIGNAIKFTAAGSVTLRVQRATSPDAVSQPSTLNGQLDDRLSFAVTDTGPGIAAADQTSLFQPFEQAHATRANAPGTGLGLAISRALVERMGGVLTLASAPGQGSTFSFSIALPHVATEPANSPATAATTSVSGYQGERRRVMIVDDHPINRALLVDLLQPLGFMCRAHASAASALGSLAAGSEAWPDLAIVDVRMEGIDGLDLTRRLRTLAGDRPLRVLLTSASVLTFNPADGRAAGCDDFLPKPFRTAELIEKIGRLLALTWHSIPPTRCHVLRDIGAMPRLAEERRAALRDALTLGDITEVRRLIATGRIAQPEAEMTWRALDDAAAGFQLSRLRQLLENA